MFFNNLCNRWYCTDDVTNNTYCDYSNYLLAFSLYIHVKRHSYAIHAINIHSSHSYLLYSRRWDINFFFVHVNHETVVIPAKVIVPFTAFWEMMQWVQWGNISPRWSSRRSMWGWPWLHQSRWRFQRRCRRHKCCQQCEAGELSSEVVHVLYPKKGVCADPVDKGAILGEGGGGTP